MGNYQHGNTSDVLNFFAFDDQSKKMSREVWNSIILKNIDDIVNNFYQHISIFSEHNAKVSNSGRTNELKELQKRYWARLFQGDFDHNYMNDAVRVGETHERVGIKPQTYIGGYCFFVNELSRCIINHLASNPKKAIEFIHTVNKIVLLDASFVLANYNKRLIESNVLTNINTINNSMEEMTMAVNEINRQVQQAAMAINNAEEVVQSSTQMIKELESKSTQIGNISNLITKIAGQTNLLALNATIEAARAGESGRGFAVVANEVKNLANDTKKATDDITLQISEIQQKTKNAVEDIEKVGQLMNSIKDISNAISAAMEEQTATASEIGKNLSLASEAIAKL